MRAQGDKQNNLRSFIKKCVRVCLRVGVVVARLNYSSTAAWFSQTISLIPCSSLTVRRNATHVCFFQNQRKPTNQEESLTAWTPSVAKGEWAVAVLVPAVRPSAPMKGAEMEAKGQAH